MASKKDKPALTHIDAKGEARMVDVSAKPATERVAVAEGVVVMTKATLTMIDGDVAHPERYPQDRRRPPPAGSTPGQLDQHRHVLLVPA